MNQEELARAQRSMRSRVSNAQGRIFEDEIKKACRLYAMAGRANIEKTPEPFRVLKKLGKGLFTGRFTAAAQPDFQGTLNGGRSVVFEAKCTQDQRIGQKVLTQEQMDQLERHHRLGAEAFVVFGIQDGFFCVPWALWRDMKRRYGRQYLTAADVEMWRVQYSGAVLFLDFVHTSGRDL